VFNVIYRTSLFVTHAVTKEHMATLMAVCVTYPEDNILAFQVDTWRT